MTPATPSPSPSPSRRPRRLAALAALVAAPLLVVTLTTLGPAAEAAPPRCGDGSPPPCGDLPEPPAPPTRPIPPPTTSPTPPPPPPATTWPVLARVLDQAEGDLGSLTAERMWLPRKVLEQAPAAFGPGGGVGTVWDPIPAGTAPLADGRFTFDARTQPTNTDMVLRVTEAGSPGPVCRTRLFTSQPAANTRLRILAAPPMAISAAQLDAMVDDLVGPVTGLDPGVEASIDAASLTPTDPGLVLSLQGSLTVTVFGVVLDFDFDADQLVTLTPSASTNLGSTLVVSAAPLPTVTLDYTGPPVDDEAALEVGVAPLVAPRIRSAVQRQAPGIVNDSVGSLHAVRWWTSQQFSLSIRKVQTSPAGLVVHPAVCRLG